MQLQIWQVGAFTDRLFSGNPAAVIPLERWLDEQTMQAIATENNVSETAFLVPRDGGYAIRWFSPTTEVALCGHATLASAYVVVTHLQPAARTVRFDSAGGTLTVQRRDDNLLELDFPCRPPRELEAPPADVMDALGVAPQAVFDQEDYLVVLRSAEEVERVRPAFDKLARLDRRGVIITAPGEDCDFVSRFFVPKMGVPEDPVTGSAHCILIPYWAGRLGRTKLRARQISARGGELFCEMAGERVKIAGRAVPYLEGAINIPD